MLEYSWLVLLPPILVVLAAYLTRNVTLSFVIGIITSLLIATDFSVASAFYLSLKRLSFSIGLQKIGSWQELWGNWNLFIFLFLIILGIIITLLRKTGASDFFARLLCNYVKNKEDAQKASLLLSFVFFIDDYFSVLTAGSVMRPIARLYGLNPVKLAFLITAVATPITILSPISSWLGEIVLQLKLVGIGPDSAIEADPYSVFLKTIPFVLYAIFMIIGAWYIVYRKISFGPMAQYDAVVKTEKVDAIICEDTSSRLSDFLFPILTLLITILIGFLYTGDFIGCGGTRGFFDAIKNTVVHQALFIGGSITLIASFIYFLMRKKISYSGILVTIKEGFWLMWPSIIMLICAWTFGTILREDLHTGHYIASLFCLFINVTFLPVLCFLFSSLLSAMIGSSWATMGIMLPLAIPMLQTLMQLPFGVAADSIPLLFPVIGATLSGAIMGTNISLISDNPIMTCASTGANHYEHIKTMSWYVMPVTLATAVAYILLGICIDWLSLSQLFLVVIIAGTVSMLLIFELLQRYYNRFLP